MSLPPDYWPSLAADYVTAYMQAFPTAGGGAESTPSRSAILLSMSVAEHETNNGRAWPGTNNFGAVQLRSLTPDELAAFQAGTLKAGDYTPSRNGVLHVDTHPTPQGNVPYPVWFAAFAKRTDGIAHFLRVLYADSDAEPDTAGATPESVAQHMWQHGYYEEFDHHKGMTRPVGKRVPPFPPEEQARIDDYSGSVAKCLAVITAALASWDYGTETQDPIPIDAGDPAAGSTTQPAA